jgi:hypothetical protein
MQPKAPDSIVPLKTYYITIGNSDNKLSQSDWARFMDRVRLACEAYSRQVFIIGYSAANSRYQNMIISGACMPSGIDVLRSILRTLAHQYTQDAIAFTVVDSADVEMLAPKEPPLV